MYRVLPSQVVAVIDRTFPWAREQAGRPPNQPQLGIVNLPEVALLLELIRAVPDELVVLDKEESLDLLAGVSALRAAARAWEAGNHHFVLQRVEGFANLHPVTLVRRALTTCPDEFPKQGTADLAFVADADLQRSLRLDLSDMERALTNSEWKATTVLAGSIMEALLLQKLITCPGSLIDVARMTLASRHPPFTLPTSDLYCWHLPDYIEVAGVLRLITEETVTQARLAKDFRNLIHPGREARLGQKCDRGTALAAVAAIEHLVRDLN
jgi:hypothetical protein